VGPLLNPDTRRRTWLGYIVSSVKDLAGGAGRPGTAVATPDAPAPQAFAAELLAAISAVRRTSRRAVRHASPAEPLPPARSELLRLTVSRPGITVAEAARELRLAPNTVSTIVGKLAADGLITRGRSSSDGRTVRLTATDQARQRLDRWRDLRAELAAQALAGLSPEDRAALGAAIPALMRLAERMGSPVAGGADRQPGGWRSG
jgi:DNA-binding MarR family transcriptional regulator